MHLQKFLPSTHVVISLSFLKKTRLPSPLISTPLVRASACISASSQTGVLFYLKLTLVASRFDLLFLMNRFLKLSLCWIISSAKRTTNCLCWCYSYSVIDACFYRTENLSRFFIPSDILPLDSAVEYSCLLCNNEILIVSF